jgi:hypothetical protein
MATKARARTRPARPRHLLEWTASAPSGSPLKVDRDAGVIYGVKVLGRLSRNGHGYPGASGGTEYTRRCMESALPMYEGVDVLVSHKTDPADRRRGREEDALGQLRNARLGDDGIRADLHYLKSHGMAERVVEDVERGLGVFGLSHDASSAAERFDDGAKRLVVESLAAVRSVDLVRKPASNRNLWESHAVKKTFRELLEALELTPTRNKWRKRLLEDDALAGPMDAPMDAPEEGDDGVDAGIKKAAMAIIDDDSKDAMQKLADLKTLLMAHEKITGEAEPEDPPADDAASDPTKTESVKPDAEVAALKHKLAVRDLCEAAGVKADKPLLESLEVLPLDTARRLVEREKARGGSPRSSGFGGGRKPAGPAKTTGDFVASVTSDDD